MASPPEPSPLAPSHPERSNPRSSLANVARGRFGEDLACRWYRNEGFDIADRNWRVKGAEIDVVATRGTLVVFAEVKARRSDRYGTPATAVTPVKQQRIRAGAFQWLRSYREAGHAGFATIRFDVVAITGTNIDVIAAAF